MIRTCGDGVRVVAPSGGGHYNHAQASQGSNSMKWLPQKMRAETRLDAGQMPLLDRYAASRTGAKTAHKGSGLSAAQVDYVDAGSL